MNDEMELIVSFLRLRLVATTLLSNVATLEFQCMACGLVGIDQFQIDHRINLGEASGMLWLLNRCPMKSNNASTQL